VKVLLWAAVYLGILIVAISMRVLPDEATLGQAGFVIGVIWIGLALWAGRFAADER